VVISEGARTVLHVLYSSASTFSEHQRRGPSENIIARLPKIPGAFRLANSVAMPHPPSAELQVVRLGPLDSPMPIPLPHKSSKLLALRAHVPLQVIQGVEK
jgi:hypothetical protein